MYQRLLLILSLFFVTVAGQSQDVMTPTDGDYIYNPNAPLGSLTNPIAAGAGIMQKWVHDPDQNASGFPRTNYRITWNQSNFKSYRWGITSFRIRFPNNYNPANKYPMVLFLHGQGEAADTLNQRNDGSVVNRENQDQLFWGAQLFEQRMNAGEWNGFLLFPQLMVDKNNAGGIWNDATITPVNSILDTLEKYNGLDPDRIITMGLSAGGFGCVNYARLFPKRIAAVASSSPRFIEDVNSSIDNFLQVPIWIATGGLDNAPDPSTTMNTRNLFNAKGGNLFMSYYATEGHDTWETQWSQSDAFNKIILTSYWNAHKANPIVYFYNTSFCEGQAISAKMGLTAGFFAYEWQINTGGGFTTIPGATANIYTATQAGTYRARFKRTAASNWSEYSPAPVTITTKKCTTDTAFVESFEKNPVDVYSVFGGGGTTSSYNYQNFTCQNGVFTNGSESFTQDALGRPGGKFILHNTNAATGCAYHVGDQVWRPINGGTVTPNTDYIFSFYMGYESPNQGGGSISNPTSLNATINDIPLTPAGVQTIASGNISWKKLQFKWNSGGNTYAQPAILTNTTSTNGNSFVLDEISLVKASPVLPMPGSALSNLQLWARGGTIPGPDGSAVGLWPNSDINGNSLIQANGSSRPILQSEGADNINFNPVTAFLPQTNKFMTVPGGFAGNTSHNSVYAYMVLRPITENQNATFLREGPTNGKLVMVQSTGSVMKWTGGEDSTNIVATPSGSIDSKTAIWSFSKSTGTTPSGFKRDIRKNGQVLASSATANAFTGGNTTFYLSAFQVVSNVYLGAYGGDIAEVVYIIDSNMTANKQSNIESYLAIKYGTTLGSTGTPVNYTASDSSIIWPASATFQNDVFGIGTDSATALVQTISNSMNSGSGDGTGQTLRGNLVLSTPTTLLNKRFLLIGNDAANLSQSVIAAGGAAPVAVGSTRINREWKVANKGGVGAVNLSFDTTGLGVQQGGSVVNNYALMIDNDGDGDFNTGTLSFFTATSASGKKINFNGVTLNNNVVFTILTFKLSSALPAIWLGFTAEAVNGNALLNWKTSDEINVDRYIVEHSFNGVSYSVIGSVTANNNTGVNNYSFTDNNLASGIHYYRIRRIDKDGKSEYSVIKSVKVTVSGANVVVRPNPVTGSTLVLAISVQQTSKTSVQIMSVDG
ncbi:MAG TPA: hypothetical protein VL307_05420, partial [Chitinophagaceae bacterium]|nr:hypothetical protein [Chitinophagaceae bacterium]